MVSIELELCDRFTDDLLKNGEKALVKDHLSEPRFIDQVRLDE